MCSDSFPCETMAPRSDGLNTSDVAGLRILVPPLDEQGALMSQLGLELESPSRSTGEDRCGHHTAA